MANNRAEKSLSVMSNSKASQWCYVNVDNEFEFMGKIFIIDDSVEEYKVYNKAKDVYDFTNESYMEEILVVLYNDNTIKFYNQNYDEIKNDKILVKS
jgi:hypothetical protein